MAGKPWWRRYRTFLAASDTLVVGWAVTLVPVIAPGHPPWRDVTVPLGFALLWSLALVVSGTRDANVLGIGHEEYKRVLSASVTLFGLAAIAAYLLRDPTVRSYLLAAFPAGVGGLVLSRWLWRQWLHARRCAGAWSARVFLVGDTARVSGLADALSSVPYTGYAVIGSWHGPAGGCPDDTARAIVRAARRLEADTIAVTGGPDAGPDLLRRLGWLLEQTPTQLVVVPGVMAVAGPRVHTRPVAGLPLLCIEAPRFTGSTRLVKRLFDVVVSALSLLLLSPVLVAIAVAVKVDSRGPVFYRQARCGRHGKVFRVWKFRTMHPDADRRRAELVAANEADGPLFKIRRDPRVTRLGRSLRRLSADELPQLINVLTGRMSLVGPRPPLPEELRHYERDVRRRLLVTPGMTGLWQISGRSDLGWAEGIELDLYYVENWSFTLDLTVLWKTARAVAGGRGAY
ncbi:sugar transferase [Amycolatopsis sp., V23-08]|uniref:Sugar transferase n=1 Tax=Amycolatopsis heterodermiae TaxID=3110235 RepID=A0ABU5R7X9_9PSEU|nr:sugar transferase [Amycolatopsis sp., V23-08]MEA5362342.1 sugar transferase [Amycolatopsis sp., V23-08]